VSAYRNLRLSDFIFCGELESCLPVSEHSDKKVFYQGLAHSFHVNDKFKSQVSFGEDKEKGVICQAFFFFNFSFDIDTVSANVSSSWSHSHILPTHMHCGLYYIRYENTGTQK